MIRENTQLQRFELDLDGAVATLSYHRAGGLLYLDHAEVPPALQGRGAGTRLVGEVLEQLRARAEPIVPVCSFVAAYLRRHPQYQDLLAASAGR